VGAAAVAPLIATTSAGAADSPSWQISTTVSPPSDFSVQLTGIAASGPDNAWIAGNGSPTPVLEQWTGTQWQDAALPAAVTDPSSSASVYTIGTTGATNTWIFPQISDASGNSSWAAFRWNGTAWTRYGLPGAAQITGAAVSGPANVWAFGAQPPSGNVLGFGPPYAAHFNGHAWRQVTLPGVPLLVSRGSASNIWAIGPTTATAGGPGSSYVYIAMHWNGSSWQTVNMPVVAPISGFSWSPRGVQVLGPRNVWVSEVVNGSQNGTPGPEGTTLLHWDGTNWTQVSQDLSHRDSELASDGHGGFWLTDDTGANFVHYSAGTWTLTPAPSEAGYTTSLGDLARIPGTRSVWADGDSSTSDGIPGPGLILKYGS